jgi:hypothetical protein
MLAIDTLAVVAALAEPSRETKIKGCLIEYIQLDSGSWITESLTELDALLGNGEVPHDLRPTGHAYFNARKKLIETSALLSSKPELVLDGEGGIDIEWENDGRSLLYACRGNPDQQDYIYFQSGLNWLLKG